MDAQARGVGEGRVVVFGGKSLLVQSVARLVDRPEERPWKPVFLGARRNSDIVAGEARAERMDGAVLSSVCKIKTQSFGDALGKF